MGSFRFGALRDRLASRFTGAGAPEHHPRREEVRWSPSRSGQCGDRATAKVSPGAATEVRRNSGLPFGKSDFRDLADLEYPGRVHTAPRPVGSKLGDRRMRYHRSLALTLVLSISLAVRVWVVMTHTYIIHPDETFQYFEQAHRLAFGSGVVPWEFIDGIRSWLLPGMIAQIMRLAALMSSEPTFYLLAVRLCCAVASLSIPYVGFRLAERYCGLPGAVTVGLLCALWYDLVYFAPVVMTEPLAAYAALWALWLSDVPAGARVPLPRLVLAGAVYGLACCLRYQYAPALALAVLWQHGREPRRLGAVLAGGVATVALGSGVLDILTWGAPFRSVWLHFIRNAVQGVASAMETQPWYYLPAYFLAAWGIAAPLLFALAIFGATRLPALALAVAATVVLHSITPHKELRFIFLASAAIPVLIGVGSAWVLQTVPLLRRAASVPAATVLAFCIAGAVAVLTAAHVIPPDAWHRDRSTVQAFDAAHAEPGLCGLGVRGTRGVPTLFVYRSGGYTYLHRDVPIYFETFEAAQHLETSPFRLRLQVLLNGQPVPQYPDEQFTEQGGRFNVLIGRPWDPLPGYEPTACFGVGSLDDPAVCVFRRPGGCE
jgi:phosphatidylinositol glycan class B